MIKSFKSKALETLYHTGLTMGLPEAHEIRILELLDLMEAANELDALAIPGIGFHRIKGDKKHKYSMRVSDTSYLIFEFDGASFASLNIENYF